VNWAALAAIGSFCGLLVTILAVVYTSGQFTQQLRDSRKDIDSHTTTLLDHAARIGAHDVDLGKLHEWKNGIALGARIPDSKD
jgi:hypothetical protein